MFVGSYNGILLEKSKIESSGFTTVRIISSSDGLLSNVVTGLVLDADKLYATTVKGLNLINHSFFAKTKAPRPKLTIFLELN